MMIPINDQLRITSDSRQWMIERKRLRKGKESWEARFYFGTLKACLKDLGELMVRESKRQYLGRCLGGGRKRCHHALPSPDAPIRGGFRGHWPGGSEAMTTPRP